MKSGFNKLVKIGGPVLLAAIILYFALEGMDWKAFGQSLAATRWMMVLLAMGCAVLAVVFRSLRWMAMLRPIDPSIRFSKVFHATNVGNLFSVAVPGVGDFVRCGRASSSKASYSSVLGTMVMERAWDMLAIFVMMVLAIALGRDNIGAFVQENILSGLSSRLVVVLLLAFVLVSAVLGIVLVYALRKKVRIFGKVAHFLDNLFAGFASILKMKRKALFLFETVMVWLMYILMSYFAMEAIPELTSLDLSDALFISAVGNFAKLAPVPGGIGAYHYIVALAVLGVFDASWELGILLATISHESHALVLLILGAVSAAWTALRKNR